MVACRIEHGQEGTPGSWEANSCMTRARFMALVLPSSRTCVMPSPLQRQRSHADAHAGVLAHYSVSVLHYVWVIK